MVVNTLKEWSLACPVGELAFPTRVGTVEGHRDLMRKLAAVTNAAGIGDYTMHAFRHFYASWCINRRADGGLELPAKVVQARLGHASIVMTLDTYGHLFPRGDDGAELAAAERVLLG